MFSFQPILLALTCTFITLRQEDDACHHVNECYMQSFFLFKLCFWILSPTFKFILSCFLLWREQDVLHNNIVKDYKLNKNHISNKHGNSSQCLGAEYFNYQHAYVCSSSFIISAFTFDTSFSLFFFSFSESFLLTSSTHDCFMLQ